MRNPPGGYKNSRTTDPRKIEALVVFLHGLRLDGADDNALFVAAVDYCRREGLPLPHDDLLTIVKKVLDRLQAAPKTNPATTPNVSTQTHATSANLLPPRTLTQELQELQEPQEPQGTSGRRSASTPPALSPTPLPQSKKSPGGKTREPVAPDLGQPLTVFLAAAAWDAVDNPAEGWQDDLWSFTRWCKGRPEWSSLFGDEVFELVGKLLKKLRGPAPFDGCGSCSCCWCRWTGTCAEWAVEDFVRFWDRIRFLPGRSPLENAAEQARAWPLGLTKRKGRTPGYARFVALAGWLQASLRDRDILLPTRGVGKELKCSPAAVSEYIRWAIDDRYLKRVEAHSYHPKSGCNKAASFRFDLDKFPSLRDRTQTRSTPHE